MAPPAKTYLMVPNFDFPTDSSIQLGNLLADPFTPHRPLTSLTSEKLPELTKSVQKKRAIVREEEDDANFSLWVQALQIVGAKTGVKYGKNTTNKYDMDTLRTSFFKTDPSDEHIKELLNAPKVQNTMRSTFWSRPVFMISGLKVAEGFSLSSEATAHHAGNLGGLAAITPQVSIGVDAGVSGVRGEKDSFYSGEDIIIAYQLLKIWRKGRAIEISEYHPKAGFLGHEDKRSELSDEIETGTVTAADLSEVDEDVVLEEVMVNEEGISLYIASMQD